jgi:hypothetical protein
LDEQLPLSDRCQHHEPQPTADANAEHATTTAAATATTGSTGKWQRVISACQHGRSFSATAAATGKCLEGNETPVLVLPPKAPVVPNVVDKLVQVSPESSKQEEEEAAVPDISFAHQPPTTEDSQLQVASLIMLYSNEQLVHNSLCNLHQTAVAQADKSKKVKRPTKRIQIGENETSFLALYDSGADITCLSQKVFNKIDVNLLRKLQLPGDFGSVVAAGNNRLQITGFYETPFVIEGHTYWHPSIVVDGLTSDVILGVDFLHRYAVSIHGSRVEMPKKPDTIMKKLTSKKTANLRPLSVTKLVVKGTEVTEGTDFVPSNLGSTQRVSVFEALLKWDNVGEASILVVNYTTEPIVINRNEIIAEYFEVEKNDICTISDSFISNLQHMHAQKRQPKQWDKQEMMKNMNIKVQGRERELVQELLWKYRDSFSADEYDVGKALYHEHAPKMLDDTPVHTKQFPLPLAKEEAVHKWVDKLLAQDVIERSFSQYNSPLFLVKKKTVTEGSQNFRVVLDFRLTNSKGLPDSYSMREIRSCLDQVGRIAPSRFSSCDLTNGFHQLPLKITSRDPTSFTIFGKGHYRFKRAPQGAMTSPAGFSRMMDIVCQGLENVLAYIDDLLIYSPDMPSHLQHLEKLFIRLTHNGLKLNLNKCTFAAEEVTYLGYLISGRGITPGTDKLEAINKFPIPRTIKQVRSWVGLCNFFRDHIQNFTAYSRPLTGLTKKDNKWKSGKLPPDALIAFLGLQKELCKAPVIAFPKADLPFMVTCDAATGEADTGEGGGYGAYLSQYDPQTKKERVIAYASRALNKNELNYSAYVAEMGCICWAVEHWHTYLYGKKFTVFTDHRPLMSLSKVNKRTLNRLQEILSLYQFELAYKRGTTNVVADSLSRNPLPRSDFSEPHLKDYNLCEIVRRDEAANTDFASQNGIETLLIMQDDEAIVKDVKAVLFGHSLHPTMTVEQKRKINSLVSVLELDPVTGLLVRKDNKAIYAPKTARNELLHLAHSSKIGGHMGAEKVNGRLKVNFWWPKMQADIKRFIAFCPICQQGDPTLHHKTLQAPLQKFTEATACNEHLFFDLCGPLHNEEGYKYCLVMLDEFSKMINVVALKSKQTNEVADALYHNWIVSKGCPIFFTSDRGGEFNSAVMKDLTDRYGIKHITTSSYHPCSNSAERIMRILIAYVKKNIENTNEWPTLLPALCLAYNTMDHSTTRFSPFVMFHGFSPRLPVADLAKTEPIYSTSTVGDNFIKQRAMWQRAKENVDLAREIRNERVAKNCSTRKFYVGQRVLLHTPQLLDKSVKKQNFKFTKHWSKIHIVSRIVSPVNVEIFQEIGKFLPFTVHIGRLKAYLSEPVVDSKNVQKFKEKQGENVRSGSGTQHPAVETSIANELAQPREEIPEAEQDLLAAPDIPAPRTRQQMKNRGMLVPDFPNVMSKPIEFERK